MYIYISNGSPSLMVQHTAITHAKAVSCGRGSWGHVCSVWAMSERYEKRNVSYCCESGTSNAWPLRTTSAILSSQLTFNCI